MQVVGIENVDYVSKKTGQRVFGKRLHLSAPISENGVGQKVESAYCRNNLADKVQIGDCVRLYYNKYQNVEDVIIDS